MKSAGDGHGAMEDRRRSAASDSVAVMRSLEVVELHEPVQDLGEASTRAGTPHEERVFRGDFRGGPNGIRTRVSALRGRAHY